MDKLNIQKNLEGTKLEVAVTGRVDTLSAPQLEQEIIGSLDDVTELVLNLAETEYISSAGLRVILLLHKTMLSKKGTLKVVNINSYIQKIFEATGFTQMLNN